jgi:hypothetical protein
MNEGIFLAEKRSPLEKIFLDKGLQNPASTSMDVHSPLLQTNV